jgi:hypothetical protein
MSSPHSHSYPTHPIRYNPASDSIREPPGTVPQGSLTRRDPPRTPADSCRCSNFRIVPPGSPHCRGSLTGDASIVVPPRTGLSGSPAHKPGSMVDHRDPRDATACQGVTSSQARSSFAVCVSVLLGGGGEGGRGGSMHAVNFLKKCEGPLRP